MDFSLNESEQALADLAEQIISDNVDHAALRELETSGVRVDRSTWKTLANAGVLAALLPETEGGAGLGAVASGAVLEAVGRHAAALPVLSTVVAGAQPIAAFGSAMLRSHVLPRVADGSVLLAAGLGPGVTATEAADGVTLNGTTDFVSGGLDADVLLVRARMGEGQLLAAVPADAEGVGRAERRVTTGYSDAMVTFTDVVVDGDHVLGGDTPHGREEAVEFTLQRMDVGLCSLTVGLCQGALSLAADYARERRQFDRVIASFQAVSQRVADAYIDLQGIELTSRSAAWRLDTGRDTGREIAIARWWAAEASNRIVHAAVHVHGGVGVDRDYPLHRHFLLARKLELMLGNSEEQLAIIGARLAKA